MIRRYRSFLAALAIMTIVWFVVDMTSERTYETTVAVAYRGIDTMRYVVTKEDRTLPLQVTSDGFCALTHHWKWRHRAMVIDLTDAMRNTRSKDETRITVATNSYRDVLEREFSPVGKCAITFSADTLSVKVAERGRKSFVPQLKDVEFTFPDGFGPSGSATIRPDTVYLYGSDKSLNKIENLYTKASKVSVSENGGQYKLELEPVWKACSDLRVSHSEVMLHVPVEAYVERSETLAIKVEQADTTTRVKLYPDHVRVTALIPQSIYNRAAENQIQAVARIENSEEDNTIPVTISDFPAEMRIKSVTPDKVQYVIIR